MRGNWGFIEDVKFPKYDLFFHASEVRSSVKIEIGSMVTYKVVIDRNQRANYAKVKAVGIVVKSKERGKRQKPTAQKLSAQRSTAQKHTRQPKKRSSRADKEQSSFP